MEHPQHIQDFIARNTRTTTELILDPIGGESDLGALPAAGSRIGGPALISDTWPWPVDPDGIPMLHLAQLNMAELPPRDGYPTDGLLQFFIADTEDYGKDVDSIEENLANPAERLVRYIPATDLPAGHAEGGLATQATSVSGGFFTVTGTLVDQIPYGNDAEAIARAEREGIDWEDYYYEAFLEDDEDDADDDTDEPPQHFFGHSWGKFAQDDPRPDPADLQILLQLDSNYLDDDSGVSLLWGDVGVAHFFIPPADLAALNFDNVVYTWDGH